MDYPDFVRVLSQSHPALAEEIGSLRGLEGVMAWMRGRGLALSEAEIVQQDEFSLDFVIPLAPEPGYLAFGIT
jgi:hypothetical protein